MAKATYEIVPLYLGSIPAIDRGLSAYLQFPGLNPESSRQSQLECPFVAFLIRGSGKNILVDTGPCDEAFCEKYHRKISVPDECDILSALKKEGLEPNDIDFLINTHLHWDHCWNNYLFPGKKIYVQRKELQYAICPTIDVHYAVYESFQLGIVANWIKALTQYEAVDGEAEVEDGVTLIPLPGHSEGLQGVLVNTAAGEYFIASDSINTYFNWRGDGNLMKHYPSGIHTDLTECFETHKKLEAMEKRGVTLLPGHDVDVARHGVYPSKG